MIFHTAQERNSKYLQSLVLLANLHVLIAVKLIPIPYRLHLTFHLPFGVDAELSIPTRDWSFSRGSDCYHHGETRSFNVYLRCLVPFNLTVQQKGYKTLSSITRSHIFRGQNGKFFLLPHLLSQPMRASAYPVAAAIRSDSATTPAYEPGIYTAVGPQMPAQLRVRGLGVDNFPKLRLQLDLGENGRWKCGWHGERKLKQRSWKGRLGVEGHQHASKSSLQTSARTAVSPS